MPTFLRNNGHIAHQEDFDAIFRRLGKDSDLRLSYMEFVDAIMPPSGKLERQASYYETISRSEPRRSRSIYSSPAKKTPVDRTYTSPARRTS